MLSNAGLLVLPNNLNQFVDETQYAHQSFVWQNRIDFFFWLNFFEAFYNTS
jgi:hypothetical protein